MPYANLQALPDWVKKQMPTGAQEIYKSAFNAALKTYNGDEGKAAATAITAVKTKYKKVGEKYVAKTESQEQLREFKPEDCVLTNLAEAKFEHDPKPMIRNVAFMGLESVNKVSFLPEAVESAIPTHFEGARIFYDHPETPDKRHLKVRELLGQATNLRLDQAVGQLRGDVQILNTQANVEFMKALAEMPGVAGFSPHYQAWMRKRQDGIEEVVRFERVHSIDLVTQPATTKSLFENVRNDKEDNMDFSTLTLKELQENRPDLVDAICAEADEGVNLEKLKTENAELKAKAASLEHVQKVDALVKEAKLSAEADTPLFRKGLGQAASEAEIKAMIQDRVELAAKVPAKSGPISAGKSEDGKKALTEDHYLKALKPNRLVD